jgi:hypothetical protein
LRPLQSGLPAHLIRPGQPPMVVHLHRKHDTRTEGGSEGWRLEGTRDVWMCGCMCFYCCLCIGKKMGMNCQQLF